MPVWDIEKHKEAIVNLCKDPDHALALYIRFFINYTDAKEYAKLYGINEALVEEAFRHLGRAYNRDIVGSDELAEKVLECINKFSIELEAASRERIEKLNNFEREILSYVAYHINPDISRNNKIGLINPRINILGESLCSMLQIDYDEAKEIAIKLLAKTGLAFYEPPVPLIFHTYFAVPPYANRIINELVTSFHASIEQKFKPFVDMIINSNDPKLISAILVAIYKHSEEDEQLFEAVYGKNAYKYLQQIKFPYNQKCSNPIAQDFLEDHITKKAKSHFDKIRSITTKALVKNDFEIIRIYEPVDYANFHGTIVAFKGYEVVIRILPFYYHLFDLVNKKRIPFYYKAEREVIVLMGPIAKPDMFKKYKYVIVGLDNNYNVINIVDNVNEDWSKEMVEVFRSLNNPTKPKKDIISEKDIIAKVNIYRAKAKEILEAVVATVFDSLGFKVSVDEKMKTFSGINVEVDVWAQKNSLKVYVSCKNYSEKVGLDIISNEIGRVMQLLEVPTMKIIVTSEFTDQAKKVAERNGFIPIELGFKVDENNLIKAYNIIYSELKKYFGIS